MSAAERFDQLGFFKYAGPGAGQQLRLEVESDPISAVFSLDSNRYFFADAEDLAEGGVADLLGDMEAALEQIGVSGLALDEEFSETRYSITVNDVSYAIWLPHELQDDLLWGYAASRTVMMLNDLLERVGSAEHAYGCLGGNDFGIFLLTPELRDAVAEVIGDPQQSPYAVTREPPNFGFPA